MKDVEIVVFQDKSWVRFSDYEKLEEELGEECNELLHFYQDKILKLEEENKQQKTQIEKMRSCENCKHFIKKCDVKICIDYNEWELEE